MVPSEIKFQKILKTVLISCFFAVLTAALIFAGYFLHISFVKNEKYHLKMIVQTAENESLKTAYLAELLELSQDRPVSYFDFSEKTAVQKLLKSPLIKQAQVKKIKPSFIYIDYRLRKPVAFLYDCFNIAVDKEGFAFPLFPFFSPKNLPEFYLDLSEKEFMDLASFKAPLKNKPFILALEILQLLEKLKLHVKRIDTSSAFSKSFGKREIVVIIEEELFKKEKNSQVNFIFPRILRLNPEDYKKQLANYLKLKKKMEKDYYKQLTITAQMPEVVYFKPKVIDLRISKLAFID